MQKTSRAFVLFLTFALGMAACTSSPERTLPILGHREPVTKTIDGQTVIDTIYQQIPDFEFLNQDSVLISNKDFESGPYIANFFFTHCPSICPTMQRNLLKVYQQYANDDRVKFLSHSIDFKYDHPSVLKAYAEKLGVTDQRWQFVTGSKEAIYGISDHYMVYTKEDDTAPGGYDHSGYFILVDKDRHIRGAYDGTNDQQVEVLFEELAILLKEYEQTR